MCPVPVISLSLPNRTHIFFTNSAASAPDIIATPIFSMSGIRALPSLIQSWLSLSPLRFGSSPPCSVELFIDESVIMKLSRAFSAMNRFESEVICFFSDFFSRAKPASKPSCVTKFTGCTQKLGIKAITLYLGCALSSAKVQSG